ncbi:MAG: hypothetical protein V5A55_11520 [Halovenus sp.]
MIGLGRDLTAEGEEFINIGVGLYLTAIGGLLTLAGVFADFRNS